MWVKEQQTGFTLLELVVATAVFAVMGVLAYGGLQRVLDAGAGVRTGHRQLAELQTAFTLLRQDIHYAAPRPVRDELGDRRPVFVGAGDDLLAELSTQAVAPDGWEGDPGVRRVAYRLRDGVLLRQVWTDLDRARGAVPREMPLLDGVTDAHARYLDTGGQWLERWPPAGGETQLPRGVEFSVRTDRFGTIRRVWVVG